MNNSYGLFEKEKIAKACKESIESVKEEREEGKKETVNKYIDYLRELNENKKGCLFFKPKRITIPSYGHAENELKKSGFGTSRTIIQFHMDYLYYWEKAYKEQLDVSNKLLILCEKTKGNQIFVSSGDFYYISDFMED